MLLFQYIVFFRGSGMTIDEFERDNKHLADQMRDCCQENMYHFDREKRSFNNVLEHTDKVVKSMHNQLFYMHENDIGKEILDISAIMHDIGKPMTAAFRTVDDTWFDSQRTMMNRLGHVQTKEELSAFLKMEIKKSIKTFYGHDMESTALADQILRVYPSEVREKSVILIHAHQHQLPPASKSRSMRRYVRRIGGIQMMDYLLALQKADCMGQNYSERIADIIDWENEFHSFPEYREYVRIGCDALAINTIQDIYSSTMKKATF